MGLNALVGDWPAQRINAIKVLVGHILRCKVKQGPGVVWRGLAKHLLVSLPVAEHAKAHGIVCCLAEYRKVPNLKRRGTNIFLSMSTFLFAVK